MGTCVALNVKLSREKTFANFAVLGYTCKFSPQNLGRGVLWCDKSEQSPKVFSMKMSFFTNLRKFSPSRVSRYTVISSQSNLCSMTHVQLSKLQLCTVHISLIPRPPFNFPFLLEHHTIIRNRPGYIKTAERVNINPCSLQSPLNYIHKF